MEMRKRNFKFGTQMTYSVDFPLNCPFCGLPSVLQELSQTRIGVGDKVAVLQVLYSHCCQKQAFAVYTLIDNKYIFEKIFPNVPNKEFPESIKSLSPRFIDMYHGSNLAEENNYVELAGSGYRNALEVLLKDFAIKELKEPEKEVGRISLFDAINAYLPDQLLQNAADVVRILGNDNTHYQRDYEEIGLDVLKSYLDMFVARVHAHYLMSHPPVTRNTPFSKPKCNASDQGGQHTDKADQSDH